MYSEYKISQIGEVIGGGTPSTSNEEYWDGTIPWITPKDLTGYTSVYISHGESYITEKGLNKSGTRLLPKNTVLFTSRAPIGYIAIAKNPICTNQGFKSIICDESVIDPLFLYYYLKVNLSYIKLFGSGATFPEISGSAMKNIKIRFFTDLNYQKKIANTLYSYDNLIETNNKRIKTLEKMAENLYKEWFVRFRFPGYETAEFENGIPKGWEYIRADKVIYFNPTLKSNSQQDFTIIPMEALSTTSMVLDSSCFIKQETITGKRSQNGDTLFAKITPCLENGKTGFVMGLADGEIAGGSTEFIVLRSKTLTPHYVYCIARSYYFRQTAILSMNGADGRQRVDEGKLKSTKVIQPTKMILDRFKKWCLLFLSLFIN